MKNRQTTKLDAHFVMAMLVLNDAEMEKNFGGNVKILLKFCQQIDLQDFVFFLIKTQPCAVFWLLSGVIMALIFYRLGGFDKYWQM